MSIILETLCKVKLTISHTLFPFVEQKNMYQNKRSFRISLQPKVDKNKDNDNVNFY